MRIEMAVRCKFYMYVSSGILSFVVSQSDSLFYLLSGSLFFAILPGLRIFIIVEAAGVHILCTVERMSKNYAGTKD